MSLRVVVAHSYYQRPGGEDRSFESEVRMLVDAGIDVATFVRRNDTLANIGGLTAARKAIWNAEAAASFGEVLDRQGPFDVAHFQNTFPSMSPAVLWEAHRRGIAVVQSLRNYRPFCVNGLLFRDGSVCEACVGRAIAWPGVQHRCYRDGYGASAAVASMNTFHLLRGTWRHAVDRFVAMSRFTRAKYVQAGFDGARIAVKPNFLTPDPGIGPGDGGFALYVGRLASGKGVATLLRAWASLGARLPLHLVGSGPMEDMVRASANGVGIRWLGQKSAAETLELMGRARMLVFPSESYETFGRVVVEAYAKGTPVVVSRIGAAAELVDDGRTGVTFAPGDADDLVGQVVRLLEDVDPETMRALARRAFEERYTAERNLDATLAIYDEAIAAAGSPGRGRGPGASSGGRR